MSPQLERLRAIVKDKLRQLELDPDLMEQAPFVICSVSEMEEFAYLLKTNDFAREPGGAPNFAGIQAMFDVYSNEKMIDKKLDAMQLKHPSIVAPME